MTNYLRHPNGNGKLYDDSECDLISIATAKSVIHRSSSVWQSRIIDSRISGSTISFGEIVNSLIMQTLVVGGRIQHSIICCEIVQGEADIKNCKILGAARVAHQSKLENVAFKNLTVSGNAELKNWGNEIFDGLFGYISRGVWTRPPKVLRLAKLTITESVKGFAYCGCYEYEIKHWLKIGEKYGTVYGLTVSEVEQIRQFLIKLQDN